MDQNLVAALSERVEQVRSRISEAAARVGRSPGEVRLLPVTKNHPDDELRAIYDLGLHEMGENRVQELRRKSSDLQDLDIGWVLIGHLQTNKAGQAARIVREVQSIDSLRIARALSAARGRALEGAPELGDLRVLLQVNTSGEEAKYGLAPEEVEQVLGEVLALPNLHVGGFMTMAPFTDDQDTVRRTFARLRELRDELAPAFPQANLTDLSMGMSHDFEAAIEEGATTVRVGTAIFGPRD